MEPAINVWLWRMGLGSLFGSALCLIAGFVFWEWVGWRLVQPAQGWRLRIVSRRTFVLYFVTWIGAGALGLVAGVWLLVWSALEGVIS